MMMMLLMSFLRLFFRLCAGPPLLGAIHAKTFNTHAAAIHLALIVPTLPDNELWTRSPASLAPPSAIPAKKKTKTTKRESKHRLAQSVSHNRGRDALRQNWAMASVSREESTGALIPLYRRSTPDRCIFFLLSLARFANNIIGLL